MKRSYYRQASQDELITLDLWRVVRLQTTAYGSGGSWCADHEYAINSFLINEALPVLGLLLCLPSLNSSWLAANL